MTMPWKHAAKLSLALLLGALSWSAHAVDEKDLLPVDQAFALEAQATSRDAIALTWKIAPGYYLYRHRTSVSATGFDGTLEMPPGKHKRDEFFGDVETYRTQLQATFAGTAAADARTVTLKVKYQGCADVGVCYPPQTRTLQVSLPSPSPVAGLLGAPAQQGPSLFGAAKGEPLPAEQAFNIEAIADGGDALLVRMTPAPGYYIYRDKTQMRIEEGDGIALRAPQWPAGKQHRDEHFGEVVVYFDPVDVKVPVQRAHAGAVEGTLHVSFQGCQDGGICYPVMTRAVPVSLPAGMVSAANGDGVAGAALADDGAPIAEDQRLARSLIGSKRTWALALFFVYGLGLAFTPCVLPMVPILSGLIAGSGKRIGAARGFSLSMVYVLSSAVVFTIAGVLAGMLGAAANLQAWMQNVWVLGAFAALFVLLALSMFGVYELQLPAALRSRLGAASDRQRGGSWWGVAAMGALSALIVGPCVAPPLMGAVLYIAQTRDPVFGGAALFLLALGMGAPLVAFGVAAGKGMPTSGPWMMTVQRVFGFVFLGLAIWMLSRVLPAAATLALWGLLALGAATWVFTLGVKPRTKLAARFASVVLGVVGAAQLLGAMAGGHDPLQPLSGIVGEKREAVAFKRIKSVEDLDRELAAARANDQPVMLDFYADWCVSCKEMEKYVFTQPKVHEALRGYVLLQADVTANDEADQALMQRFGIIGPPMSLFFRDGEERRGLRLTGFEEADKFVERARSGAAK
ncbi:protein-disulfide reductase DsbD [Lysobacter sp. A6]|uniref:Thiol:disulfide interchange protein DsbD n=1 Tax=Noviluteimonas lactosilytica TaxID=2888523 RepID=A0ABS8JLC8_9GAMM|nr:protein-disulfide reductase DsbD [Lysobacter lactosilyticus]MCC8364412.1 protein-disulfide reductase DsbD [Lysobacter lactosilyticus]